jgi:hypothetical protein
MRTLKIVIVTNYILMLAAFLFAGFLMIKKDDTSGSIIFFSITVCLLLFFKPIKEICQERIN